jgi:hypothetical protein
VLDDKSPYWDAPVSHAPVDVPARIALVDAYLSAVIDANPTELGAQTANKRRPIQLMNARETEEEAKHGEVLRWSPTLHYVTTGLHLY